MIPVIYFSWSVFYLQIMNAIPSGISQSFTDTPSFTVFFHCFSQLLSNLFVRYKGHLIFSCLPAFHVLTESGNPLLPLREAYTNIRFDAFSHRSRMPHALRRALRPFLAALPQTLLLQKPCDKTGDEAVAGSGGVDGFDREGRHVESLDVAAGVAAVFACFDDDGADAHRMKCLGHFHVVLPAGEESGFVFVWKQVIDQWKDLRNVLRRKLPEGRDLCVDTEDRACFFCFPGQIDDSLFLIQRRAEQARERDDGCAVYDGRIRDVAGQHRRLAVAGLPGAVRMHGQIRDRSRQLRKARYV